MPRTSPRLHRQDRDDPTVHPTRVPRGAGWRVGLVLATLATLAACGEGEDDAEAGREVVATDTASALTGDTVPGPMGAPGADSVSPATGTGVPAAGAIAQDSPGAPGAPGTALDSLRREIRQLSARVERSARATDSLLALVTVAPAAPASRETAVSRAGSAEAGGEAGGAEAGGAEAGGAEGADARILQDAAETARSYGIRAFWAVLVLVLAFFAVRAAAYALNVLSERSAERRLFFKRLVPIVRIVLWTFAVYFVIRVIFAVDAQGLFAAAAAVGVAIGFAAQDLLKNIFGGLVIVFDQPFQVGDKIQVGDSYGEVVSIGLRSTRIVTPDDSTVSVPNAQVVDSQVSNANSGALDCQVVTDLYLPGFVDEARAKAIAYQAAASSRYVYLQKPIVVLVKDEFRETFLTHLKVKAYVLDARHEFAFMSDVTERARAEFRRQGLMKPMDGARAWVNFAGAGNGEEER